MATVVKDLGAVTAYAYAVEQGYTGTEEEFAQLMASYADVAEAAAASAQAAAASEAAAAASEQAAKTSETAAAGSASSASTDAATASSAASTATQQAGIATSGAETATQKAADAAASTQAAASSETAAAGSAAAAATSETNAETAETAAQTAQAAAEAAAQSVSESAAQIETNKEDIADLKSALVDFEGAMKYVGYGVKQNGDVVFTSENVNEGDVLYYKLVASGTNGVAYIGFFDAENTRLAYYGKGSGSSTVLTYEGTAEIPTSFAYCRVFTNNGLTLDIKYLTIGKPLTEKVEELYNIIDSPFDDDVHDILNGIIAFNFLGSDSSNTSYWMENIIGYRVTSFFYKASGFYMYMPVQKFVNGEWTAYDAIEILLADAPTETPLTIINSKYGYFQIAFIPSLSTSGSVSNTDYRIKRAEIKPFYEKMRQLLNRTVNNLAIADYELQDHTSHIVTVKQDGSGDYTTIAAAYAAITDSSFLNQYEIVVYPGTYEEVNLICPNFSHTHGLAPNTVTVTSVGKSGTQPVFEQRNGNSKLSNMTIISGTGYCVHQDSSLNGFVLVNENLHCIKDYGVDVSNYGWESKTNPSVIGDGAQYYGAKFIWRNCTFENGEIACHSNSNSNDHANQHFILENCRLVNARIWLGMAGNEGASPNSHCVAEIKGLYTPPGCQSLKYKLGARVDENEPNFIWQIIGGENENFAVVCDNTLDTQTTDMWGNINTNEKALVQISGAVTKGQWLKYDLSVCGVDETPQNVFGVALENGSSGDTIQVWIGNAFPYTATNGEYGIGANGELSESATVKIGRVYKNILYRY